MFFRPSGITVFREFRRVVTSKRGLPSQTRGLLTWSLKDFNVMRQSKTHTRISKKAALSPSTEKHYCNDCGRELVDIPEAGVSAKDRLCADCKDKSLLARISELKKKNSKRIKKLVADIEVAHKRTAKSTLNFGPGKNRRKS
jgi:hypothetical protein